MFYRKSDNREIGSSKQKKWWDELREEEKMWKLKETTRKFFCGMSLQSKSADPLGIHGFTVGYDVLQSIGCKGGMA